MACFHRIHAYKEKTGTVKFGTPQRITDRPLLLACGQCSGCRLENSRQWAVRIMHEASTHKKNSFITLTYDETHLGNNLSLDVKDWQKFAKRSRKYLSNKNLTEGTDEEFRFFHCGEYGDKYRRKHLHAAILGQDYTEDRIFWKKNEHGDPLYRSKLLDKLWGNGMAVIGELTFESAAYVARYVMKKRTGPSAPEHYETMGADGQVINLKPEYSSMSRNPGIGQKWIRKYLTDVYPWDEVIVNEKKTRPPVYYDNELKKINPEMYLQVKQARVNNASQHSENNTDERLLVREEIQKARIRYLSRDL